MMAAKLCAIHLLPDVLMDRNPKQREHEPSSQGLDIPFSFAHKVLLTAIVFAAFLRMIEYSLFPSLYQRPFQTEEEQSYYLDNDVEFCQGYRQIKSSIGRSGGLELLMYFIHELCWLAIFIPLPYIFVPDKWETPSWSSSTQQSAAMSSSSSNEDIPPIPISKKTPLWKDFFHWLLRPAYVQPLRISSTTSEEMALLVLLGMVKDEDEDASEHQAACAATLNSNSENKKKKSKKADTLYWLDSARIESYLGSIMNSSPSSKASSNIHSIMNQQQWISADPWSELRWVSVTLIFCMALLRLYSFLSLINFQLFGFIFGTGSDASTSSIMALDKLVIHGFYGVTRNPMCLASLGSALGLLCAVPSPMGLMALPVLYSVVLFQVSNEEKELLCFYGRAYNEYTKKVPRFLGVTDFFGDILYLTTSMSPPRCKTTATSLCTMLIVFFWFMFFWDYGGLRYLIPLIQRNEQKRLQEGGDALFMTKLRASELLNDNQCGMVQRYGGFDASTIDTFTETLRIEDELHAKQKEWKKSAIVTNKKKNLKHTKQSETDFNSSMIDLLKSIECERIQRIKNEIVARLSFIQATLTDFGLTMSVSDMASDEKSSLSTSNASCSTIGFQRDGGIWKECLVISDQNYHDIKLFLDTSAKLNGGEHGDSLPFLFSAKRHEDCFYISPYYNFPESLSDASTPQSYYCAKLAKDNNLDGHFKMYLVENADIVGDDYGEVSLEVSIKAPLQRKGNGDQICSVLDNQVKVNLAPSTVNKRGHETELVSQHVKGFVGSRVDAFSPHNMFLVRHDVKARALGAYDVWLQLGKRSQCDHGSEADETGDKKTCYALEFDYQMDFMEAFGVALCPFLA